MKMTDFYGISLFYRDCGLSGCILRITFWGARPWGYAAGFVAGLILIGQGAALLFEFFQKRGFYKALLKNLEELDRKYLLSEMTEEPSFYEGKILCEVTKAANKSMNDEIAKYRCASQEYREYIETWVHEVKPQFPPAALLLRTIRTKRRATFMRSLLR